MKRVLLTGATGFIGSKAIPRLLEKMYEVHAVYYNEKLPMENEKGLYWHQCDLFWPVEQKRLFNEISPTHLLHFAWETTPGKFWTCRNNLRWVQASLELLMNFVDCRGSRAVLAGSCAEYDWSYGHCSENDVPTRPSTLYGACKNSLQQIVKHYSLQSGLSSAWGRIFFLYGPHEHFSRLVSSVIIALINGEPVPCSHGGQIRDFLYVKDAADAFVALLESDVTGPVNIASGSPVAIKVVIDKIAAKMGRQDLVQYGVIPVGENDPQLLTADTCRLNNEVGWFPAYDLDTGLEQTIKWWKNNLSAQGKR